MKLVKVLTQKPSNTAELIQFYEDKWTKLVSHQSEASWLLTIRVSLRSEEQ